MSLPVTPAAVTPAADAPAADAPAGGVPGQAGGVPGQAGGVPGQAAPQEAGPRVPRRAAELTLQISGCVISVLAALFSAVLELFFASLRVGSQLIGVSAVAAVLMNLAICWFAFRTVGRRWAVGPPWVVWTVVMFVAAGVRTTEGDYLLAGDNWVGLIMILLGSLAFAIYAYRMILARIPQR